MGFSASLDAAVNAVRASDIEIIAARLLIVLFILFYLSGALYLYSRCWSVCGKSQDQVKKLIAGPGVYMCNECVGLCNQILDEEYGQPGKKNALASNMFSSSGVRGPLSHPLKDPPPATTDSAIASIESLLAFCEPDISFDPEPFMRVLLVLLEVQWGAFDERLLPLLEKLYTIYNSCDEYQNCINTLDWMIAIVDETGSDQFDRIELLIKLTKMHIRLGNGAKAEEILNRLENP